MTNWQGTDRSLSRCNTNEKSHGPDLSLSAKLVKAEKVERTLIITQVPVTYLTAWKTFSYSLSLVAAAIERQDRRRDESDLVDGNF